MGFSDEGSSVVLCACEMISILNAQGDYASELAPVIYGGII